MFIRAIVAASLVCVWAMTASAQQEPTVRRLYLLCQIEDPQCGDILRQAEAAYFAKPIWRECVLNQFNGPTSHGCPTNFHILQDECRPTRHMPIKDLFIRFMDIMQMVGGSIAEEPAKVGVFYVYRTVGFCTSSQP